ncbi:galactokinase [Microbotryomycetes sp. JL201]|nr:galactokinase [Microbotryomycetes sp. JL201]
MYSAPATPDKDRFTHLPHNPIPLATSLDQVYTPTSLATQGQRWDELARSFERDYGVKPQKVTRAPGRVNIIGDHIDYCGFSVLPAAVERDVLIAYSTSPSSTDNLPKPSQAGRTVVVLRNVDEKYTDTHFEVDVYSSGSQLSLPQDHHWSSYFIAGTKGILKHMHDHPAKRQSKQAPELLLVKVWGTVPEGSGLSSSSAMTTASAITMLEVVGRREGLDMVARRAVTEVAIESERLVGVNSGGMDQTASVFSKPLHLLDFVPKLQAHAIPLPETNPRISFVIANTLVTSNKKLTAKFCYNLRASLERVVKVVETRLAALLLHKALNLPSRTAHSPPLDLQMVLAMYFATPPQQHGPLRKGTELPTQSPPDISTAPAHPSSPLPPSAATKIHELKTMLHLAGKELGGPGMEDGMTWEEVASKLDRDLKELQDEVVGEQEVEPIGGKLRIWSRARHVFSEALRVHEFCDLLKTATSGDGTTLDSSEVLQQLGDLMNASMESSQKDADCSCPELDEMTALARKSGAYGSRITGAGWGGATVSLVPEPKVKDFIQAIRQGYFAKKFPDLTEEQMEDACFATKPEAGAGIYVFE